MHVNSKNPCYPFEDDSVSASPQILGIDLSCASLQAICEACRKIHSFQDFTRIALPEAQKIEVFSLIRSLALLTIDEKKYWLFENCSSIYDLCARQKNNLLSLSRSSVCEGLKTGRTLHTISGFMYREQIHEYLTVEGQSLGRGVLSADDGKLVFRLLDFAGHASKLALMQCLIKNDLNQLDWHEFFEDTYEEYEAYVHKTIRPRSPAIGNKSLAGNRPGQVPEESATEKQAELTAVDLDPFAEAYSYSEPEVPFIESNPDALHRLPAINFKGIAVGALGNAGIPEGPRFLRDKSFLDRAYDYMDKMERDK